MISGLPSSTFTISSRSWLPSKSACPIRKRLQFCRHKHWCGDQAYRRSARQRNKLRRFHCQRIPAIGKTQNAGIRGHQVHFQIAEAPATDRRFFRYTALETQLDKRLLQLVIVRQCSDLRHQIHIVSHPRRCGSRIGQQQIHRTATHKHQLLAQPSERPRDQLHLGQIRILRLH